MYVVAASRASMLSEQPVPAGACHGYRFGDTYTLCRVVHLSQLQKFPILGFPPPPKTDVDICDGCLRRADA